MKTYQRSLHIFRRDLRLQDNSALIEALKLSEEVIPCFIFDKRQIEHNDYKSDHCVEFMATTLQELDDSLRKKGGKLYYFYGTAEGVVQELLSTQKIDAIFVNRDYTPFSRTRDEKIAALCKKGACQFHSYADALLNEPEQVKKANLEPYSVFTPYMRKARENKIRHPYKNNYSNYYVKTIANENHSILKKLLDKNNLNLMVKGGRKEALTLLKKMRTLKNYKLVRNFPAESDTTKLSAHIKFGTISIRECYHAILDEFGKNHTLLDELYWHDFFTQIAFYYPHVFGHAFHQKYDRLPWQHNENHFRAWREGQTGFPIVDAGMRELNLTGYMHNRVRMIAASFLIKDLHIDWRLGEKYFAQQLVDYDPAVNNGNWQWVASTGCDAQPYFRIFNPWLQQAKYDPDCLYIKKYIPELARIPNKIIHTLYKQETRLMTNYPQPIVAHEVESQIAKRQYRNI